MLGYAPIAAAGFGIPQFLPQMLKLRATRDTAGVSWSWAALTTVNNAAWIAYFALSHDWSALVPSCSVTLLAGVLTAMLTSRRTPGPRALAWMSAWAAALAAVGGASGRVGLGTLLTAAFAVQVAPSLRSAYRTARPSGISAGTWTLILGELACFLVYGLHEADPRLIALGLTGIVASTLMLARICWTARRRGPSSATPAGRFTPRASGMPARFRNSLLTGRAAPRHRQPTDGSVMPGADLADRGGRT
jgi:uncharacterized protein with PQ loop repeat